MRQYEAALKELTDLLKSTNAKLETRKKTKKEDVADDKLQAVERLISVSTVILIIISLRG